VGRQFSLFTEDAVWVDAAHRVSAATGVEIQAIHMARHVNASLEEFRRKFGLGPGGASLVRPDGIVGWRSVDGEANADEALFKALRQTACLREP